MTDNENKLELDIYTKAILIYMNQWTNVVALSQVEAECREGKCECSILSLSLSVLLPLKHRAQNRCSACCCFAYKFSHGSHAFGVSRVLVNPCELLLRSIPFYLATGECQPPSTERVKPPLLAPHLTPPSLPPPVKVQLSPYPPLLSIRTSSISAHCALRALLKMYPLKRPI